MSSSRQEKCRVVYVMLSELALHGGGGVDQDLSKALHYAEDYYMWCSFEEKGAAAFLLAQFYVNGWGVKNPVRKNRLLKEAAEKGVRTMEEAQNILNEAISKIYE